MSNCGFAPRALAGQTIVVTGVLEHFTREEIESQIREFGGRVASSVSNKTTFVVAGEKAGSKLDKARSLGITIIGEKEFLKRIGR